MLRLTVMFYRRRPEDKRLESLTFYHDEWEEKVRETRELYPLRKIERAFTLLAPAIAQPAQAQDRWEPLLFVTPDMLSAIIRDEHISPITT